MIIITTTIIHIIYIIITIMIMSAVQTECSRWKRWKSCRQTENSVAAWMIDPLTTSYWSNTAGGSITKSGNPNVGNTSLSCWSESNRAVQRIFLAPPGALIAIPTYYWSTTPTFSDTHRSSIMDFHFLSHASYIKGNHWTHLLATCIPYKYNRTTLQDSAR